MYYRLLPSLCPCNDSPRTGVSCLPVTFIPFPGLDTPPPSAVLRGWVGFFDLGMGWEWVLAQRSARPWKLVPHHSVIFLLGYMCSKLSGNLYQGSPDCLTALSRSTSKVHLQKRFKPQVGQNSNGGGGGGGTICVSQLYLKSHILNCNLLRHQPKMFEKKQILF